MPAKNKVYHSHKNQEKEEQLNSQAHESDEERELDLSSLSEKEQDDLILQMEQEEMMVKQIPPEDKTSHDSQSISKRKFRKRKTHESSSIAPGFGWVAIKMSSALTFSFVFLLLGIIFIFLAIFKYFGTKSIYDWYDLLFGLIGIGLIGGALLLFKYIVKD